MTDPSQYFKGRTVQEQMDEVIGYVDTRAAEVATAAIAADVAQVHQDMLDADADASAAAASAAAAAGTLANAVKKTGEASQSIAGDIAISGALSVAGAVTVPAPTGNTNPATKKYVDDQDALNVKLSGNQTVADVKTFSSSPIVPTVATGTADTKAANGTKVKNELDNYAPMLRTTGNQTKAGQLTLTSFPIIKMGNVCRIGMNNNDADTTQTPSTTEQWGIYFADINGVTIGALRVTRNSSKVIELSFRAYKQDGSFQSDTSLATINQQ